MHEELRQWSQSCSTLIVQNDLMCQQQYAKMYRTSGVTIDSN